MRTGMRASWRCRTGGMFICDALLGATCYGGGLWMFSVARDDHRSFKDKHGALMRKRSCGKYERALYAKSRCATTNERWTETKIKTCLFLRTWDAIAQPSIIPNRAKFVRSHASVIKRSQTVNVSNPNSRPKASAVLTLLMQASWWTSVPHWQEIQHCESKYTNSTNEKRDSSPLRGFPQGAKTTYKASHHHAGIAAVL